MVNGKEKDCLFSFWHSFVLYDEVKEEDFGVAHEPGLRQQNDRYTAEKELHEAVVFVRKTEDGPVPEDIEEKEDDGQRIVDSTAIVGFYNEFLSAALAVVIDVQELL
ncbi:MAG: hypothetical protein EOP49_22280 [Sphingobacteriales bacterium]|nr:MAG: hypothetical protein EOP49_22280 [Sphingobacteriales bacterium]